MIKNNDMKCFFISLLFFSKKNTLNMQQSQNALTTRKRIPFSKSEDALLMKLVKQFGESNWEIVSFFMNGRTVRQCRERWQNSLSPTILKTNWTIEEDQLLLQKYYLYGPHWKLIEPFFYGRTSYSLRNRFHSIKKKNSEKFYYPQENNNNNNKDENIQKMTETNEINEESPSVTKKITIDEKTNKETETTYTDLIFDSFCNDFNNDINEFLDVDFDEFHVFDSK